MFLFVVGPSSVHCTKPCAPNNPSQLLLTSDDASVTTDGDLLNATLIARFIGVRQVLVEMIVIMFGGWCAGCVEVEVGYVGYVGFGSVNYFKVDDLIDYGFEYWRGFVHLLVVEN